MKTATLLCEGRCSQWIDVYTEHAFARVSMRHSTGDKAPMYRCTVCGEERQYGLEPFGTTNERSAA